MRPARYFSIIQLSNSRVDFFLGLCYNKTSYRPRKLLFLLFWVVPSRSKQPKGGVLRCGSSDNTRKPGGFSGKSC